MYVNVLVVADTSPVIRLCDSSLSVQPSINLFAMICLVEMFGHHENSSVTPKFVKDTSKYWYKPSISRDEGKNISYIYIVTTD